MNRLAQVHFNRKLISGEAAIIVADPTSVMVFRDLMLFEFMDISNSIPFMTAGTSEAVYKKRDMYATLLNRLDSRPGMIVGRSQMCINNVRITMGEVDFIKETLEKVQGFNDKDFRTMMKYSMFNMPVKVRAHFLSNMFDRIQEEVKIRHEKISHNTNTADNL